MQKWAKQSTVKAIDFWPSGHKSKFSCAPCNGFQPLKSNWSSCGVPLCRMARKRERERRKKETQRVSRSENFLCVLSWLCSPGVSLKLQWIMARLLRKKRLRPDFFHKIVCSKRKREKANHHVRIYGAWAKITRFVAHEYPEKTQCKRMYGIGMCVMSVRAWPNNLECHYMRYSWLTSRLPKAQLHPYFQTNLPKQVRYWWP